MAWHNGMKSLLTLRHPVHQIPIRQTLQRNVFTGTSRRKRPYCHRQATHLDPITTFSTSCGFQIFDFKGRRCSTDTFIHANDQLDSTSVESNNTNTYTYRTHNCGQLRSCHICEKVTLYGWLQYQRMNKFLLLRDSYGMTQCVLPESANTTSIPLESVLKISGTVHARPIDMINNDMATGEVEVMIDNMQVLNVADGIPFTLKKHQKPKEQLRMQYRYIDLRYPEMQYNLRLRSHMLHNMRRFLIENNAFVEVETPTLFCRTPGGAREFVVPTHHPGMFYSLVQSPQQFKQMLMVGGMDRYFQLARCYRDESTRPDRQPEFTQLDIEMSFTSLDGILKLIEHLLFVSYPLSVPKPPFKRLSYEEALETYGSDKPDIRYELKLNNITQYVKNTNAVEDFSSYSLVLPKELSKLPTRIKEAIKTLKKKHHNVETLDFNKMANNIQSSISNKLKLKQSETLLIAAGLKEDTCLFLGEVRILLSQELKSRNVLNASEACEPLWIVDFPLFTCGNNGTLETCHHPFTAPHPEDIHLLEREPLRVRSLAFDLVMNGSEVGGGSVRVHDPELQVKLFKMLNIDVETMRHFEKALRSGCPPHAGIALGIDRMMAIACNVESIRDVIAFPKSHEGKDPLSGAPSSISEDDRNYYNIIIRNEKQK